ncbi:MAG TPA: DUF4199 domain-containing protein [Candidatus Eisenbacteria bacterium]|nr:DUF4199 domain-containing protein [Candidatus Eisenbacteria bacterium]
MNAILKWGIVLGVLCEIWAYLYVAAGWHKNAATANLFWVVILIQLVVLVMGLRQTAAAGRGYGGQLVAGTLISIVGGIIILIGSYICTTMVFPNYMAEYQAMQEQALRAAGRSEAEIQQIHDLAAKTSTPVISSVMGCIGTVVTGFFLSLILGAFIRAKKA